MAKAKKTEGSTEKPASAAVKKKPTKAKAAEAAAPMVDTNLAAESAAKRLVARLLPASAASTVPLKESASFKHLKDSINKPSANGLAGILDKTAGPSQNHSNTPFHGGKQTGRNQVFGADVNRSGVPRRTGGG